MQLNKCFNYSVKIQREFDFQNGSSGDGSHSFVEKSGFRGVLILPYSDIRTKNKGKIVILLDHFYATKLCLR